MSTPTVPQIFIRPNAIDQALEFYWSPPVSDGGNHSLLTHEHFNFIY